MTETGYGVGEGAISSLISGTTGFTTSGQVGRGKWNYLNQGKGEKYCILLPGATRNRSIGPGTIEQWTTTIQVWRKYKDDGTTLVALEADVEAIIRVLDAKPRLSDSTGYVQDSRVSAVSAAITRWMKSGGPVWLCQDITVEWEGFRTTTFS